MSDRGADIVPEWVFDRITDDSVLDLSGEDLGNCRLTGAITSGVRPAHKARILAAGWNPADG